MYNIWYIMKEIIQLELFKCWVKMFLLCDLEFESQETYLYTCVIIITYFICEISGNDSLKLWNFKVFFET